MRMTRTTAAFIGITLCATMAHAQATQRGFSVILLLGETQGGSTVENLPPAPGVRKALADVKEFLPYKRYRVLDTQWSRSGSTRMRGLDDQEYDVELNADVIMPTPAHPKPDTLMVLFKLQEVNAAATAGEEFSRSVAAADMEKQRADIERQIDQGPSGPKVPELMARKAQLEKQIRLARARRLIESRFEMQIGETVVVGTSKLGGGDKGLVVLLPTPDCRLPTADC
jgi:hypothetical protein